MEIYEVFSTWRKNNNANGSWALAWFLANEFCKRYYASHGIVPMVINHDGLGYYGIQLSDVKCGVNSSCQNTYGRMTMAGNVEKWKDNGPGDSKRLETINLCNQNILTEEIIRLAIEHMDIAAIPRKSHINCRHKRWGSSYTLCFEVAAILAIKNSNGNFYVTNNTAEIMRALKERDSNCDMKEHMGAFYYLCEDKSLLIAGDGRVLDGSNDNIWMQYMNGKSPTQIASYIERSVGIQLQHSLTS